MAPCPSCATENRPGAPFCVECGTGLAAATGDATVRHAPPALAETTVLADEGILPPAGGAGGGGRPVLTVLAVLLAIVAVGVAAYVVGAEASDDDATTTTAPSTSTTTTAEAPDTATTDTSVPERGPVDELPAGLSCRELADRGYSYAAAATYWFEQGQPAELDADGDGLPCGTVYPAEDVEAYWADR